MSERYLEDRLFDAVWQRGETDVRLAIATALALARREGYVEGYVYAASGDPEEEFAHATRRAERDVYSLPTRTVRKLREEPDPHFPSDLTYSTEANDRGRRVLTHAHCGRSFRRGFPEHYEVTEERAKVILGLTQRPSVPRAFGTFNHLRALGDGFTKAGEAARLFREAIDGMPECAMYMRNRRRKIELRQQRRARLRRRGWA